MFQIIKIVAALTILISTSCIADSFPEGFLDRANTMKGVLEQEKTQVNQNQSDQAQQSEPAPQVDKSEPIIPEKYKPDTIDTLGADNEAVILDAKIPHESNFQVDNTRSPALSNNAHQPDKSTHDDYWGYILIGWAAIVLLGAILGWNQKIVVFRNYNDLGMVFASGVSIYAAIIVAITFASESKSMQALSFFLIAIAVFLLIYLIARTFIDNKSFFLGALALVTKITLSGLFLFNLISLLSPSGKTQRQRSKDRSNALLWLIFLTPVIYHLVRDKEGIFCPRDIFNKYQRGRIGI